MATLKMSGAVEGGRVRVTGIRGQAKFIRSALPASIEDHDGGVMMLTISIERA